MKKVLFLTVCAMGLFFAGCSSDKDDNRPVGTIDDIENLPYSSLTPEEQKVKLEKQGEEFLKKMEVLKTSEATMAYLNLSNLLDMASPFSFTEEDDDDLQPSPVQGRATPMSDIFRYAAAYGVYTWNATDQDWDITESTSNVKFIFPVAGVSGANSATFTLTATESDVIEPEGTFYMPATANGVLTVNQKEVGTLAFAATYQNKTPVPATISMNGMFDNGLSFSVNKTTEYNAFLKHNGVELFSAKVASTIDLNEVFEHGLELESWKQVGAYFILMDNLALTVSGDLEKAQAEIDQISNRYSKEGAEKEAEIMNKHLVITLADRADATKIATVVFKAENEYGNYYPNTYLKFNDKTLIQFETYFKGFTTLQQKLQEFLGGFFN